MVKRTEVKRVEVGQAMLSQRSRQHDGALVPDHLVPQVQLLQPGHAAQNPC